MKGGLPIIVSVPAAIAVIPRQSNVQRVIESLGPLPNPAPGQPAVVMMAGLPGTGKSTIARRLAKAIGGTVLESDAVRQLMFGRREYSSTESFAVFRTLHTAARYLLALHVTVVVDATSILEKDRKPLYRLAEEARAPLFILQVEAPASVVEERLARRKSGAGAVGDRSEAGLEVYERMSGRFQPIREPHWRVDTSDEIKTEAELASLELACRRVIEGDGLGEKSR